MSDVQSGEGREVRDGEARAARRFGSARDFTASPDAVDGVGEADRALDPDEPQPVEDFAQSAQDDLMRRLDPSRICPSRHVDLNTAYDVFLKETFPDGSPRSFMNEFRARLMHFQIDVLQGRLPVEAIIYDFPEEFYNKTPEEMREFFDRMISSTGIGEGEPAENPLGLHPFLWRLFRRLEEPEKAVKRLQNLRTDAEFAARQREQEAVGPGADAPTNELMSGQGVNGSGSGLGFDGAEQDAHGSRAVERGSGRDQQPSRREPVEASWRPAGSQAVAARAPASNALVDASDAGMVQGSRPVGLLSGMWHLGGSLFKRVGDSIMPSRPSWVGHPDASREATPVVVAGGFDVSAEAIERDCQRLCELAAWVREASSQGPMVEAMRSFEALSAARGMDGNSMWRAVHDVANGVSQDPEVQQVADMLTSAIREQGLDGSLREMATIKSELTTRCHNRLLALSDQGEDARPELERIDAAVSRLKDAELPFEKPGEDTGLRELSKLAEHIKKAIERLLGRIFGHSSEPASVGP